METLYLTEQIFTAFPEALNMAITTIWKRREREAKPLIEGSSRQDTQMWRERGSSA